MAELTKRFKKFLEEYPEASKAYEDLGKAVHAAGPLDEKTRALIKLSISASIGSEGAVHSHTRRALEMGITHEEIHQTILLALPTIGLPKTMAAMSWVDDILDK